MDPRHRVRAAGPAVMVGGWYNRRALVMMASPGRAPHRPADVTVLAPRAVTPTSASFSVQVAPRSPGWSWKRHGMSALRPLTSRRMRPIPPRGVRADSRRRGTDDPPPTRAALLAAAPASVRARNARRAREAPGQGGAVRRRRGRSPGALDAAAGSWSWSCRGCGWSARSTAAKDGARSAARSPGEGRGRCCPARPQAGAPGGGDHHARQSGRLDSDGAVASAKHCRDTVAAWLGCDDGDERVRWGGDAGEGRRRGADRRGAEVTRRALCPSCGCAVDVGGGGDAMSDVVADAGSVRGGWHKGDELWDAAAAGAAEIERLRTLLSGAQYRDARRATGGGAAGAARWGDGRRATLGRWRRGCGTAGEGARGDDTGDAMQLQVVAAARGVERRHAQWATIGSSQATGVHPVEGGWRMVAGSGSGLALIFGGRSPVRAADGGRAGVRRARRVRFAVGVGSWRSVDGGRGDDARRQADELVRVVVGGRAFSRCAAPRRGGVAQRGAAERGLRGEQPRWRARGDGGRARHRTRRRGAGRRAWLRVTATGERGRRSGGW